MKTRVLITATFLVSGFATSSMALAQFIYQDTTQTYETIDQTNTYNDGWNDTYTNSDIWGTNTYDYSYPQTNTTYEPIYTNPYVVNDFGDWNTGTTYGDDWGTDTTNTETNTTDSWFNPFSTYQPTVTYTPIYQSCTFNGQTIEHGGSVTAYQSESVTGGSCQSQTRTCDNSTLSGSYQYGSCEVVEVEVTVTADQCDGLSGDAAMWCQYFMDNEDRISSSYKTNPATYPWGTAYVLRAFMNMYKATEHPYFLDRFIEYADAVWANRDDKLGETDFEGNSGACWSDNSDNYCWVVHSGHITYPMMVFVDEIYTADSVTKADYKAKADEYHELVKEVVAEHDDEFYTQSTSKVTIRSDEGYYRFANNIPRTDLRGHAAPNNQQIAMASTAMVLMKYNGGYSSHYTDIARRIGRVFWRDLEVNDKTYVWHYWWGDGLNHFSAKYEDTAHSPISIEFIKQAYDQGFEIGNTTNSFPVSADITKFYYTFALNIRESGLTFNDRVDGSTAGGCCNSPAVVARWALWADYSTTIYNIIKDLALEEDMHTSAGRLQLETMSQMTRSAVKKGF